MWQILKVEYAYFSGHIATVKIQQIAQVLDNIMKLWLGPGSNPYNFIRIIEDYAIKSK